MSAMTMRSRSAIKYDYPFLAHPPQKKRPLQPLPPPPTSPAQTTFSAIATWAAHVQPGSPAASLSPRSPRRRPSLRKGRRPSIVSIRVPSASFLHIVPTPTTAHVTATPSLRDFKADLTSVGYTSVFLQLPNSPIPPTRPVSVKSPVGAENIFIPSVLPTTSKPRGLTRFHSLSALRSRRRSKSFCPDSPTKMRAKDAATSAAMVRRKKVKYAACPPPLATDLALMQFIGGGSMEDNIKCMMKEQAKAAGTSYHGDVYRDGNGGFWRDQDEELEYVHLLAESNASSSQPAGDLQWVTFDGSSSRAIVPGEQRRDSVSTDDFDQYMFEPTDTLDANDLAPFGGTTASLATRQPAKSVLVIPSRPHRAAKHLQKPDYIVDTPFMPFHPSPPGSPELSTQAAVSAAMSKLEEKAKRRPVPLKLSPPSPAFKWPTNSPIDSDKARADFIDASNNRPINSGMTMGLKKKQPKLNMMGLFRSAKKEDRMLQN